MPISDLECFIKAAEELNFSKAAESLFITQSALSKTVGRLEKKLGFDLFVRDTRAVTLTPAGKSLYRNAIEIVDKYHQSVAEALALNKKNRPLVRVGGQLTNLRIYSLLETLRACAQAADLPFDVELDYEKAGYHAKGSVINGVFSEALAGKNDVTVLYCNDNVAESTLEITPLYQEKLAFFVSQDNDLACAQEIELGDLRTMVFVESTTWRDFFKGVHQACRKAGFVPRTRTRLIESIGDFFRKCSNDEVLVTGDSMSSFIPSHISNLVKLPCEDPRAYVEVAAVHLPEKNSDHIKQCVEQLRKIAEEYRIHENARGV